MKREKIPALFVIFALAGLFVLSWSVTSFSDDFYVISIGKQNYAPVEKTGQSTSHASGDDGDFQKGLAWPEPRFRDNGDSTVTDNLTGLMWLKDFNCVNTHYPGFDSDGTSGDGAVTWQHALDFVAGINGGTFSACGRGHTDWRLPNLKELLSLTDYSIYNPCLPSGHPFENPESDYYWSSTTATFHAPYAWVVHFDAGITLYDFKSSGYHYVHAVRGGS